MLLITGANGQLGSELKARIQEGKAIFTDVSELDVTDPSAVNKFISENHIKGIINCAAYTAVDKAESEKDMADLINHKAVGHLVRAINEVNGFMVHISTDYVFDGKNHIPYKEEDPTNPQSVYGASKLEGENLFLEEVKKGLLIRTSWVYSEYGANFVKTILRLCAERSELNIVSDQIGSPTYAGDLAEAILVSIEKSWPEGGSVFHYSNEGACSWYDFAQAIAEISELPTAIYPIETKDYPTPAVRPHYSLLNKSKGRHHFNWKTPHWRQSLKVCLKKLNS